MICFNSFLKKTLFTVIIAEKGKTKTRTPFYNKGGKVRVFEEDEFYDLDCWSLSLSQNPARAAHSGLAELAEQDKLIEDLSWHSLYVFLLYVLFKLVCYYIFS